MAAMSCILCGMIIIISASQQGELSWGKELLEILLPENLD